jgi:putative holliday junction resolvase
MRHLGVDYGTKRIGVAISDEEGKLAFPYCLLKNDKKLYEEIKQIIQKEKIQKIIIGESKDYSGRPNEIMMEIEKFKEELKNFFDGEIIFQPEFMTSMQAEKGLGARREDRRDSNKSKSNFKKNIQTKSVDVSSAVIILQSYLDMRNNE